MRYTIISLAIAGMLVGGISHAQLRDSVQVRNRQMVQKQDTLMLHDSLRVRERTMNAGDTIQLRIQNQIQNRNTSGNMVVEHEVVKGEGTKTSIWKRIFTRKKTVELSKEVGSQNRTQLRDTLRLRTRDENGDGIPDSLQVRTRQQLRLRDGSCGGNPNPNGNMGPNSASFPNQRRRGR